MKTRYFCIAALLAAISFSPANLSAQAPQAAAGAGRGGPAPTPKASAPIDLTGTWTTIITQDWRFRMVTPTKGDYWGVPMNAASRKIAEAWDPKADEAAGNQCKSYGAPAFLRLPAHFRFSWENDRTLKLESDTGTQTRLLHFDAPATPGPRTWQGNSLATWERAGGAGRGGGGGGAAAMPAPTPGSGWLKVVTTNLKPGYLRKNGVPYSESAVLTEYFDLAPQQNGQPLLFVTTEVADPVYLNTPFVISSHFRKMADGSAWDPSPCSTTW